MSSNGRSACRRAESMGWRDFSGADQLCPSPWRGAPPTLLCAASACHSATNLGSIHEANASLSHRSACRIAMVTRSPNH